MQGEYPDAAMPNLGLYVPVPTDHAEPQATKLATTRRLSSALCSSGPRCQYPIERLPLDESETEARPQSCPVAGRLAAMRK